MGKEMLSSAPGKSQSGSRTWLIVAIAALVLGLCCCVLVIAGVLLFRSGWLDRVSAPRRQELPTATLPFMEPDSPFLPVVTHGPDVPDGPIAPDGTEVPGLPILPGMDISDILNPEADPVYGPIDLQRGFTPDPHVVGVGTEGILDLEMFGMDCGYVNFLPTFAFSLGGGASDTFLRIYFVPDGDVAATLVIHTPDQKYLCGKQSTGEKAAVVDLEFAASGKYTLWVGVQQQGASTLGMLSITGSANNKP
jgi:hypothetical protein